MFSNSTVLKLGKSRLDSQSRLKAAGKKQRWQPKGEFLKILLQSDEIRLAKRREIC